MSNPVLVALANVKRGEMEARETAAASVVAARLDLPPRKLNRDEWPVFEAFCAEKKLPALPACSATVALFILHEAHLGIDRLLAVVEAISAMHGTGVDPTFSPLIAAALNRVAPIAPPRSFSKEQKARFVELTYPMQLYVAEREQTRDRDVRKSQNKSAAEISKLKKELQDARIAPAIAAAHANA